MYARGLDGDRLVALFLNELGSDWHVYFGLKFWPDQDFGRQFTAANSVTFLVYAALVECSSLW